MTPPMEDLKPILTPEQIEQVIREKYPKTPGEFRCPNEKRMMAEIRQWYRDKLTQENEENEKFNRQLRTSAV